MPTDSADHDLTSRDNADAPRCPMERLADRMEDCPRPKWLGVAAWREPTGRCEFRLKGSVDSVDSIDELINFLARVKA